MPTDQNSRLLTLAILAGGEGSRMGRPKGLLEIRGRPILEHLLARLAWPGATLLVTGPGKEHPPGWENFDRETVDPVAGEGPLRGLLTALDSAASPLVIVATVDMPGIQLEQMEWLVETFGKHVQSNPGLLGLMMSRQEENGLERIEPFPSIFRREGVEMIRRRLETGMRSVHALTRDERVATVSVQWPAEVWLNLNHPEDVLKFEVDAQ